MGNKLSNQSGSINPLSVDGSPVQPEDIHKIILKGYEIITNRNSTFGTREKRINKLYSKYSCLINPLYPHFYNFIRNSFNYEFFVFIGTIGNYAIDVVLYFDLLGWIVLNDRSCFRNYNTGGSNKLQYSVSKRKTNLNAQEKSVVDAKKQEVEHSIKNENLKFGPNIFVDNRYQPLCRIVEPANNSKVDYDFWLKVSVKNWKLSSKGKHYIVLIDGKLTRKINHKDPISISLDGYAKGWHNIEVILVDESKCKTDYRTSIKVYLKPNCSSSSSSDSSSSCSSSSDSSSSDSSSSCSSSSDSSSSDSSSSCSSSSDSSSSDSSSCLSSSCYSSSDSSSCSSSSDSSSCSSSSDSSIYCSTCCSSTENSSSCSTCCSSSCTDDSLLDNTSSSEALIMKKGSLDSSGEHSILKIISKDKKRLSKGDWGLGGFSKGDNCDSKALARMAWLNDSSENKMSSEYRNRSKKLQECAKKIRDFEMSQYGNF